MGSAQALRHETLEQIEGGYTRIVKWSVLRKQLLAKLKLSPIAAIPHKSRAFRKILDLSFALNDNFISVNDATDDSQAPLHAMYELGRVLPRLIHAMATVSDSEPLLFAKIDLKDGYWRMVVPTDEEYNFAYVLPQLEGSTDTDFDIVIPSALQMGWKLSPPYFCAASETARDVTASLLQGEHGDLPPHDFEHRMLPPDIKASLQEITDWNIEGPLPPGAETSLYQLLEVYVDDFIGVIQSRDPTSIMRFSRAILHGIHSVFPPPSVTGHTGHDPISEKKLDAGDGIWESRKEILGWIFDGIMRTIELPSDKVDKITTAIKLARRNKWMPRKAFESLRGKLRHATLGMPEGRSLMGPFDRALAAANHRQRTVQIHRGSPLDTAMADFLTLLQQISSRPTHCKQLVPGTPGYLGYVDACKSGVGGAWLPGTNALHPVVWRFNWPAAVQEAVITDKNPNGTITINDLEMAGFVIQFLALEELVGPLTHQHIAVWCDNTSAVSWIRKMKSSKSAIGQRLARVLSLRMSIQEVSPLAALSIAGIRNKLADIASRSYTNLVPSACRTDVGFLTYFNSKFPLLQNTNWHLLDISKKILSLVCSELLNKQPPMASWKRLPKRKSSIGTIGSNSATTITWTHGFDTKQTPRKATHSLHSLNGSGKAMPDWASKYSVAQYHERFAPSGRNLKWTTNPTRSTNQTPMETTGDLSNNN